MDVHHIKPKSKGGSDDYENLIALCPTCHRMVHEGKIDRQSLLAYKANLRYAFDKYFPWEMDILFDLSELEEGKGIQWLSFMDILIKRIMESGFVEKREPSGGVFINNMKSSPDYLLITKQGRQFVNDLRNSDLFKD